MTKIEKIADVAKSGYLNGMPYSRFDCQGYLKAVCRKAGMSRAETAWIGTNDIWRNWLDECHLIREASDVPVGAVLLTADYQSEAPRRYADRKPNCKHCGVFIGGDDFKHSTTGGVQTGHGVQKHFTHWGILKGSEKKRMLAKAIEIQYKNLDGTIEREVFELGPNPVEVIGFEVYADFTEGDGGDVGEQN